MRYLVNNKQNEVDFCVGGDERPPEGFYRRALVSY